MSFSKLQSPSFWSSQHWFPSKGNKITLLEDWAFCDSSHSPYTFLYGLSLLFPSIDSSIILWLSLFLFRRSYVTAKPLTIWTAHFVEDWTVETIPSLIIHHHCNGPKTRWNICSCYSHLGCEQGCRAVLCEIANPCRPLSWRHRASPSGQCDIRRWTTQCCPNNWRCLPSAFGHRRAT